MEYKVACLKIFINLTLSRTPDFRFCEKSKPFIELATVSSDYYSFSLVICYIVIE